MNWLKLLFPDTKPQKKIHISNKTEIPKDSPFYNPPKVQKIINKQIIKSLGAVDYSYYNKYGNDAVTALKRILKESVMGGIRDSMAKQKIIEVIPGIDKKEAKLILDTLRNWYLQSSEDIVANVMYQDGIEVFWGYSGPEDNQNRDECVWALHKRFFTDSERRAFENQVGIRIGCRHIFTAITKSIYDEGEKPENDLTDEEKERRKEVVRKMEFIYGK